MSIVWLIIMLVSVTTLLAFDPAAALAAMIKGASDAVLLSLDLIALYGIWLGLFGVLEKTGMADKLAHLLRPLVRLLFKGESEETEKYIAMNVSANLLGLGNAATPMGINAVRTMRPLENAPTKASPNMIMLVVLSATSLQIFPSTVVGLRAAAGSADPADFLLPCIAATVSSTLLGVLGVRLITAAGRRRARKLEVRTLA